jgi:putative ABC transport system permease protein
LQGYAFRIDLHWTYFLLPLLAMIAIAFLTVSFQSIKGGGGKPGEEFENGMRVMNYE